MPSGVSSKEVENTIESIALQKANKYNNIGYLDSEDIKQEVRIKCISVLPKYDPNNSSEMSAFLSVCAENKIRDLRRKIVYNHDSPCFKCPFWDDIAYASGYHDCLVFKYNKFCCDKFKKHEMFVQAKLSNSYPVDIDEQRVLDDSSENQISMIDMIDFIEHNIDKEFKDIFDKLFKFKLDIGKLKQKEREAIMPELEKIISILRKADL